MARVKIPYQLPDAGAPIAEFEMDETPEGLRAPVIVEDSVLPTGAATNDTLLEVRNRLPADGAASQATLEAARVLLADVVALLGGVLSAQIQGAVEVTNDAGNPLPVAIPAGVEIANDAGSPIPVSLAAPIEITNDAGAPIAVSLSAPVEITNDTGAPIAVAAAALPLPAGAAEQATLAAIAARLPELATTTPVDTSPAQPVRQVPADLWRVSFAGVGSGLQTPDLTARATGAGMTVAQSAGNLTIATGTTANAETLIRSVRTFRGGHMLRYALQLSQRIANQLFEIALADTIAESAAFTVNSATSVSVTLPPGHGFTPANVGQSMNLGAIVGVAAAIPGRWAIASVAGDVVTFTVAGWPASGSGTLDVWGWNYHRIAYSGTTATNASYDAQRRGWNSGDTTATINTTAAPGHIGHLQSIGSQAVYADTLAATIAWTTRAGRLANLPDDDRDLRLYLVARNGSTAPASTTTLTLGFVSVEMTGRTKVIATAADQSGAALAAPVTVQNTPAVSISGTPTVVASGTVGPAAHDAAISGNPVRVAGRAVNALYTAVANGDVADLISTLVGALVTKPYAIPEATWNANLSLTSTTATALAGAAGAGLKRHITALQAINTGASAVDLILLDGATERWRLTLPPNVPVPVPFPTELLTTANTALNANLSAAGTVRVCAQGYTAP